MKPAQLVGGIVGLVMLSMMLPHLEAEEASSRSFTDDSETVADLKLQISRLEESLALVNTEAGYFHKKWLELRLKVEALGIEALTANEKKLSEKNIRLLGDLFRSEKEKMSLEKAIQDYLQAEEELKQARPLEKAKLRAELEGARRTLLTLVLEGSGEVSIAANLNQGRVTLFDEKTQVAIVNFGKAQGAIVGTPFRILDENEMIGRCRLLEVREYLSAALVEDLAKNKTVQPGNRLLMDTVK
jgi:hypothetical protein